MEVVYRSKTNMKTEIAATAKSAGDSACVFESALLFSVIYTKKADTMYLLSGSLVPEAGLEPAWYCYRRILSPLRLPVSPLGRLLCYYSVFFQGMQSLFYEKHRIRVSSIENVRNVTTEIK